MTKYRKKPVVIEAWQVRAIDPDKTESMPRFIIDGVISEKIASGSSKGEFFITTLEGTMRADVGDWIIRGVKGELYPCKPDIFEATYDEVIERSDTEHFDGGRLG